MTGAEIFAWAAGPAGPKQPGLKVTPGRGALRLPASTKILVSSRRHILAKLNSSYLE